MKWLYGAALFLLGLLGIIFYLAQKHTIALLQPAGSVAGNEHALMVHAILLMLIVIVPVYLLTFFFAYWYRAGNTKAAYTPDWEHSKMDELIWWAVPFEVVLVLGALTWTSTHELDPHRPLASVATPITIQVVALPSKWLFMYPDQRIATVNFLEIPVGHPINFRITADAPMNSFWIPQLGGQIMAITGMVNPLALIADKPGDYHGMSANYSGDGFVQMQFIARAVSQSDFDAWVAAIKEASSTVLNLSAYNDLLQSNATTTVFGSVTPDLYTSILAKFMGNRSMMQMSGN